MPSRSSFLIPSLKRSAQVVAAILPFALLTGCGIGAPAADTGSYLGGMSGIAHGGPNPVIGATVKLYSTGATGYGAGSTLLATVTSGSYGQFTFPANTCVAGSEVYVTAAGGVTGSNTTNANSLLVSALGDCSTVSSSTQVFVSELTTVAAAYALSNFTTITGTGATTVVNIGATAANSVATPSCTGTGSAQACVAAGLKHAFANALNLASSVTTTSGGPSGLAYTTTPSNPGGTVPTTLLNTIADIVQACVNSSGGVAGDGSGCGTLFTNTTPPSTSTASPITPTNTFQAMINLAKYPSMTAAQVSALFALASSTAFFQPTLTTAPHDFSVAIYYASVTVSGTATTFGYPYFVTLDYNDNVYAMDMVTSSAGPVTALAMTSNGSSLYASGTVSTAVCVAGVPCMAEPDTNGTIWLANGSTTVGSLYPITASTGAVGTALAPGSGIPVFGVAVDKYNAVFTSVPLTTAANTIYSVASGGSSLTAVTAGGSAITQTATPAALAFDASGNLWNADKYTASTSASTTYLANTGTTSTAFGAAAVQTVDDTATANGGGYGMVIDSSGTGWTNGVSHLYKATSGNASTPTSIAIASGTTTASSARYSAIDGANNIFIPDNNSTTASYIWQYIPGTGNFVYIYPCAVASATTVCSTTAATETIDGPRNAQIDSTGSIWIASSTNGHIVQVIGTAAPAWPQLSYGKPGVNP